MEHVGGAAVGHVIALRGGSDDAIEIGAGLEKRLVDGAQDCGLVRVLRLPGIQRRGLIIELNVKGLVLGEPGPLR